METEDTFIPVLTGGNHQAAFISLAARYFRGRDRYIESLHWRGYWFL